MFLVDSSRGGSEFRDVVGHIGELLERNGAEIQRIERWDERKLAYPVKKVKRGIYVLTYFRADGSAIAEIKNMANLSEQLLRLLIVRAEQVSPVQGQLYSPEGEEVETPELEPAAPQVTYPAEAALDEAAEDEDEDEDEDEEGDEEELAEVAEED
jgi:ribosomal protein S6